jgi:hypothetical protein
MTQLSLDLRLVHTGEQSPRNVCEALPTASRITRSNRGKIWDAQKVGVIAPQCAPRQRPSDSDCKAVGVSATEQGDGAHPLQEEALPEECQSEDGSVASTNCTIHICAGVTDRAEFVREIPNYGWCEIRFGGRLLTANRRCVILDPES